MPKCLLVYFSQGGTTERVAGSIAAGLRAEELQVTICDLGNKQPPSLKGYDLLGIGSPTYFFRPPFNVTDYVNGLPELGGLPVFAFVLHGTYQGDAANAIRKALARKGAREVGYFHCHGADYAFPYLKEGYLFSPDHPGSEELAQAEEFGRRIAARLGGECYVRPEYDLTQAAIYRFERFLASRWLVDKVYSRLFRVDRGRCTACGLCVEGCPTGNITADAGGHPVWGRNCLACLYCEMNCPEEAITSPASLPLFLPFFGYNVRQALRDPALDRVQVVHSQGQTQRL
jgi:flavodoxin/ferredoxin